MYSDRPRLSVCVCVSVCLSLTTCLRYPDVIWGNSSECTLVVHCWVDLQSVHGFRCYGNIRTECEMSARMPVLAVWLVSLVANLFSHEARLLQ